MITKAQKRKLKKFLKNDWIPEVVKLLDSKGIVSRNNTHYSESTIRVVFNGYKENAEIEAAILEVYEARLDAFEKAEAKKKELLSA